MLVCLAWVSPIFGKAARSGSNTTEGSGGSMALDAVARSTENRGNIDLKSQHLADMMRICRASFPDMLRPKQEAAVGNIDEDLGFIPELLLAVLMSQYTSMLELNHTLHFDWVRTWEGWREAEQEIALCNDDADLNEVTKTYVQRFTRLVWNNYEVKAQTDAARKAELIQSGRRIGIGKVHGNNDCCADSLLQLLAHHAFVPVALKADTRSSINGRKEACSACRAALVSHENERLHPRARLDNGTVNLQATDEEHNGAYLQHDVHAEFVVRFFLEYFSSSTPVEPRGITVVVYTRWDSELLPPSEVTFGRVGEAEPTLRLEMFNNTGHGNVGVHYDPVFPCGIQAPSAPHPAPRIATAFPTGIPAPPAPHPVPRIARKATRKTTVVSSEDLSVPLPESAPPPSASSLPAPQVLDAPRRKRFKSADPNVPIVAAGKDPAINASADFFTVRCMPDTQSPDARCKLEAALVCISEEIRQHPTVPADPNQPTQPYAAALREDIAVPLPKKQYQE